MSNGGGRSVNIIDIEIMAELCVCESKWDQLADCSKLMLTNELQTSICMHPVLQLIVCFRIKKKKNLVVYKVARQPEETSGS